MAKNQGPWGNNDNANPWGDNEETLNSPKAVSYTHLDVYKRQTQYQPLPVPAA